MGQSTNVVNPGMGRRNTLYYFLHLFYKLEIISKQKNHKMRGESSPLRTKSLGAQRGHWEGLEGDC